MKNKLTDLNDHLFAQLERLGNEELSPDKIDREVQRAKAIVDVGKVVVESGRLMMDATELKMEMMGTKIDMPKLLNDDTSDATKQLD